MDRISIDRRFILTYHIYIKIKDPANSQVSTSDDLTGPPPPLLPVPTQLVSLPLQLMKAPVPAESYVIHLYSPAMSTGSSQVGAVLSPPC